VDIGQEKGRFEMTQIIQGKQIAFDKFGDLINQLNVGCMFLKITEYVNPEELVEFMNFHASDYWCFRGHNSIEIGVVAKNDAVKLKLSFICEEIEINYVQPKPYKSLYFLEQSSMNYLHGLRGAAKKNKGIVYPNSFPHTPFTIAEIDTVINRKNEIKILRKEAHDAILAKYPELATYSTKMILVQYKSRCRDNYYNDNISIKGKKYSATDIRHYLSNMEHVK